MYYMIIIFSQKQQQLKKKIFVKLDFLTQKYLLAMTFFDITRIAGSKHGSKIKKGHIRFVMVIQFKFQIGKLIIRTIITSILDVIQESGFVDIFGV